MINIYIKFTNTLIDISKSITTFRMKNAENFRKVLFDISDSIIISDGNECIDLDKKIYIIKNLSEINCNEKKILNFLYKNLESIIEKKLKYKFNKINKFLIESIDELLDICDFNFTYNPDIDIIKLLNALDVQFEKFEYDEYLKSLLQYINLVNYITKSKIFITYSLMSFITNEEYELLIKELELMDIMIINFEMFTTNASIDYIIDEDNCIY